MNGRSSTDALAGDPAQGSTAGKAEVGQGDSVQGLLADWTRERPDLDFSPIGVVARLGRLRSLIDAELDHVFDRYDLSSADFVVIVSLRRAGTPYRLNQASLAGRMGLTSGTVSVRIDRLAARGIVAREPDPTDRRIQQVRLTAAGLALFDVLAPVHLANEDRLLSALEPQERGLLAELLRVLLASLETTSFTCPRLGIELLESHLARSRRRAVGLSDPPGLLIAAAPEPGSPAALTGLRQGDLLTEIDGVAIRNRLSFGDALDAGRIGGRPVHLTVLRGEQTIQVTIPAVPAP